MKYLIFSLFCLVSAQADSFEKRMKPFLEKHCVACHGEEKQKGKLRLDNLSMDFSNLESAEQWQFILDELNGATMPPDDEAQPSKKELTEVLEVLTYEIEEAKKQHEGKDREIVMRRLNKREYINTMFELTGVRFDEKAIIDDQSMADYDNHGEDLYVSSFLLGKYREYANEALTKVFAQKAPEVISYKNTKLAQEKNDWAKKKLAEIEKNNFKSKKNKGEDPQAEYNYLKAYLKQAEAREGLVIEHDQEVQLKTREGKHALFKGLGNYKIAIEAQIKNLKVEDKGYLVIENRYLDISELSTKKQTLTFDVNCNIKSVFKINFFTSHSQAGKGKRKRKSKENFPNVSDQGPKLILSSVAIEHKDMSLAEGAYKKIFPVAKKSSESHERYAGKVIKYFAQRAYRGRQISYEFYKFLMGLYKDNVKNGMNETEAIKEPLVIILSSPKFVYLTEVAGSSKSISDLELAIRLSYFLWSAPPDKELYKLAANRKLRSKSILKQQVVRMLKDRRSRAFSEGFFNNWLEMENLELIEVKNSHDSGPQKYSLQLERLLKREPLEFFRMLILGNLSITNMLDSEFLVLNQTLASYYKLPVKISENKFQVVKLPSDSPRGGLMGMGAILAMLGNGDRSSPVLRGNFVLTKMMGMASPPPPPNVPDLEIQTKGNIKDKLKAHQEKPQCASCHNIIDPAGFGLESFDQSGQWLGINKANKNVVEGKLPSLGPYKNYFEQRKLLLNNKDNFAKAFIKQLCSYAFARKVGFADGALLDRLSARAKSNDYKLRDIICDIVLSNEFMMK